MLLLFNLMSETKAKRDTLIFNVAMYVSCLQDAQDAGVARGWPWWVLLSMIQREACRHASQWQTALGLLLMMLLSCLHLVFGPCVTHGRCFGTWMSHEVLCQEGINASRQHCELLQCHSSHGAGGNKDDDRWP